MIHFFNPGHETAVLNGSPYYMAPANVLSMQHELAYLPAWYVNRNDNVFVWSVNDNNFYKFLTDSLGKLPQPLLESDLIQNLETQISFWGISPQAIHYWSQIQQVKGLNLSLPKWDEKYTYLNSRVAAKDILSELLKRIPQVSPKIVPEFFASLKEIEDIVGGISEPLLAKAPFSSSGRGLLWLPIGGLTQTERQILHGILKKQGQVSIEKVLNKEIDFAMEFISNGSGTVKFIGYSLFDTNKRGAYLGNYLGSQEYIIKLLTEKISEELLDRVKKNIEELLSLQCGNIYNGCIGVDMMIYKYGNNYYIHPCLEINMRYNMGYLALKFSQNYLSENSEGHFFITFKAKSGEIYKNHQDMRLTYPAQFERNKLKRGYLPLCPVNVNSHYWAYALVSHKL